MGTPASWGLLLGRTIRIVAVEKFGCFNFSLFTYACLVLNRLLTWQSCCLKLKELLKHIEIKSLPLSMMMVTVVGLWVGPRPGKLTRVRCPSHLIRHSDASQVHGSYPWLAMPMELYGSQGVQHGHVIASKLMIDSHEITKSSPQIGQ